MVPWCKWDEDGGGEFNKFEFEFNELEAEMGRRRRRVR